MPQIMWMVVCVTSKEKRHSSTNLGYAFHYTWLEGAIFIYFQNFWWKLEFVNWGEPRESTLKEPILDDHLGKKLLTLHNFKVLVLKDLLSKQTLFNIRISQASPQGAYRSHAPL